MKTAMTFFFLIFVSMSAFASSTTHKCSNADGSIMIAGDKVTIVTHKEEQEVFFIGDTVEVSADERMTVKEEVKEHSSSIISVEKIVITKTNSEEGMPNAYSRLANEDGSLADVFVCSLNSSWM